MEASSFSILFSCHSKTLTQPDDIIINLQHHFSRKQLPKEHEDHIEHTWQKRLTELPSLFNGTKFRLDSLQEKDGLLHLNIGLTCYKDFQGTNLSENVLVFQSQGLCDHDNSQAYLSDALGVGAVVVTKDDHLVLLFRSKNCGEDVNLWDRPGGHCEPKVLVGNIPMEKIDISAMDPKDVTKELFNSIVEEVISEVNIPRGKLTAPGILGVHRSNLNGGKPNVEFLVKCDLTALEVEALYSKGSQDEAYESEKILLLELNKALDAEVTDPALWRKMAVGAKAALTLYKMYRHRFL